jgi:hypothetical protein
MMAINPLGAGDSIVSMGSQYLSCFAICLTHKRQPPSLLFINYLNNSCEQSKCN